MVSPLALAPLLGSEFELRDRDALQLPIGDHGPGKIGVTPLDVIIESAGKKRRGNPNGNRRDNSKRSSSGQLWMECFDKAHRHLAEHKGRLDERKKPARSLVEGRAIDADRFVSSVRDSPRTRDCSESPEQQPKD